MSGKRQAQILEKNDEMDVAMCVCILFLVAKDNCLVAVITVGDSKNEAVSCVQSLIKAMY